MNKIYNFSSGPAMLQPEVLKTAREEMLDYQGTGMSVMELSSDSAPFKELIASCEESLRTLMGIPQNYKVLFMQGGATSQFSAIPLNLLSSHKCADYVITGQHSKNAYLEAKKYGDIKIAASYAGTTPIYSAIPELGSNDFRPDADYVHICYNNTIYGTKFAKLPETGSIPLVVNMSSCILSEPVDVSKCGVIYASVHGNIAPAGMAIVIIREDLLGKADESTPSAMNYKLIADSGSLLNTPPIWSIYMAKLNFDWILSVGGLDEMKRRNERKASLLYDFLDAQQYFASTVSRRCRSMMNVVFVTGDASLDRKFGAEADAAGFKNLAGHKSVGGMRATLCNAMPAEGVEALVDFMRQFALSNPKMCK